MREGIAAELILSLVASPASARSTIGDLLEERPARGSWWFWWSVFRTAGAGFLRDLFAHPLTTLGLAASGWLAQVVSGFLLYSGPYLVLPIRPNLWTGRITAIALCTLAPFVIGWSVGKGSKGREVATSLVAGAVLPFGVPRYPQISALSEFSVLLLFTLAGAILYRVSTLSRSPHASPPARR